MMRKFIVRSIVVVVSVTAIAFSPWTHQLSAVQAAQAISAACKATLTQECLAKEFANLTTERRITFAFATLEEMQKNDGPARDCHFIAHSIAAAEVKADPGSWRIVLNKLCPSSCSYGCGHGVLEAYASLQGRELTLDDLRTACDSDSPPSCPHGIGHLLLVQTSNQIDESITQCHQLKNTGDAIFQCVSGVFMENSTPVNLLAHGLIAPPMPKSVNRIPELESTCRRFSGLDAAACWQEIAPAVLEKANFAAATISYCDHLTEISSIRECQLRMIDTFAWAHNFDINASAGICHVKEGPDYQELCFNSLVNSVLENLPSASPSVGQFCAKLDSSFQTECFGIMGDNFSRRPDLNKEFLAAGCRYAPTNLKEVCASGGHVDVKQEPVP